MYSLIVDSVEKAFLVNELGMSPSAFSPEEDGTFDALFDTLDDLDAAKVLLQENGLFLL